MVFNMQHSCRRVWDVWVVAHTMPKTPSLCIPMTAAMPEPMICWPARRFQLLAFAPHT